jgi:MFS family permease
VLGYDAVETGLAFLPVSVGIGVLSVGLAPRLTLRFGARAVLIPSLALLMAGLALFSRAPVDGDYVSDILPTMLLFGIGAGMSFPALMTLAMSGASPSDAGLASGLVNTTQQVGGALGLAVLATLATSRTDGLRGDGESVAVALTEGYQLAFSVGAALLAGAIVLALVVLKPVAKAPQHASMEPAYSEA